MKKIWPWMKANLAIVILSAVIVVSLPAAFVASSMLNNRLRTARQTAVEDDFKKLEASRVTYTIPSTEPGAPAIQLTTEPNAELTRSFKEARATLTAQITEVESAATQINRADHRPLVEGLFPEPTSEPIFKKLEMAEKIVGKPGHPSAYEALLASIHAGRPANPSLAVTDLVEYKAAELERVKAERGSDELSPEEQAALAKRLAERRIGLYQQHAKQISVYADMDLFRPLLPKGISGDKATWEYFLWQWDYWIAADLLRAVGEANSTGGTWTPVDQSPVKRIVEIEIKEPPIYGEQTLANEEWTPPAGATESGAPLDPQVSVTGRRSSKLNKLYDVRFATLKLLVDSERLQDVVNAISRTNFMTVIGVNVVEARAWQDLDEGYYYGPAHVVEATLQIESVWLRSWTADLMPDRLRIELGMEARDPNAAAAAPPPPPEAPPSRRRSEDDEPTSVRGGGGG